MEKTGLKCLVCGDVLVSWSTHDWRSCRCFNNETGEGCYIDGGDDYCRVGGRDFEFVEVRLLPKKD